MVEISASEAILWPTPNKAFEQGKAIKAFVQPTSSGKLESGLYGCVRNGGHKFHEGLDLYPIKRTASGEAADPVYAVLAGTVVHVSKVAGHSSYGRYVVVEHDGEAPAFYTLYSHLATVAEGVSVGQRVPAGAVLGIMGRSAAGYQIPKTRAHLHFEIGFRLTDSFQFWYDRQKFGSPNQHGNWNGMNLMGIDPLAYYRAIRSGRVRNMVEYLVSVPAVARIRVHSAQIPDFVRNYPALVTRPYAGRSVVAWDIAFTQFGVPKEWTPRFADEALGGRAGDVRILAYSPKTLEAQTCRRVLNVGGAKPSLSATTLSTLKKLFGFK